MDETKSGSNVMNLPTNELAKYFTSLVFELDNLKLDGRFIKDISLLGLAFIVQLLTFSRSTIQ